MKKSSNKYGYKKSENLDELWEMTEGTATCLKCDSPLIYGHIREVNGDLATVDWVCEDCGHKWSACCPFDSEHGVITTV